jgi:hypothetical protein
MLRLKFSKFLVQKMIKINKKTIWNHMGSGVMLSKDFSFRDLATMNSKKLMLCNNRINNKMVHKIRLN